jgi:hypothetical protein
VAYGYVAEFHSFERSQRTMGMYYTVILEIGLSLDQQRYGDYPHPFIKCFSMCSTSAYMDLK